MSIAALQKQRQNGLPPKTPLAKKLDEPQSDCICFKATLFD